MALAEQLNALEPRERRLITIFAGAFFALCLFLVPIGVSSLLSDKTQRNTLLHLALKRFQAESGRILEQDEKQEALLLRYKTSSPALAGFLDKIATATSLEIPEIKDRSPILHGKKYEERPTSISLKKVGLLNLVKFMEKVSGSSYPIGITRLNIRKRRVEPDSYDAQLVVAAYHRIAPQSEADDSGDSEQ